MIHPVWNQHYRHYPQKRKNGLYPRLSRTAASDSNHGLFKRMLLPEIRPVIHVAFHILDPAVPETKLLHLPDNNFIFCIVKGSVKIPVTSDIRVG